MLIQFADGPCNLKLVWSYVRVIQNCVRIISVQTTSFSF
ncbi:hypothetical protein VCRA2123O443_10675 [Vibrio crassostreae]|nr:hypothetical protein VCRA2110O182_10144 [Vibrio crassostreae]CAK2300999.1 hypothetical protein VCRA211O406_10144 [Vibrio crassostreae]CAK2301024.1 hypothetical protein VCRA2111O408_10728 [Vibrio crassostreae]CAK3204441.1 hypothetical protein VCRA2123O443_10675 [Vibrio crassostreae]